MNRHRLQRPASRRNFEIALICALPLEADASEALFDHYWDDDGGPPFDKALGDPNTYSTGAIGRHNVVLAHMPGMGKANAAFVAANCRTSFPNIRLAIIVGICGSAPFTPDGDEIVLGDVIISDGVVQYDLGRRMPEHFIRKDTLLDSLGRPNVEIRGLLSKLRSLRSRQRLQDRMSDYLSVIQREPGLQAHYPGIIHDKLFSATYRHISDGKLCDECGCDGPLIPRNRLSQDNPQPVVHFGLIASGDTVLKSGEDRDRISRSEGAIGFEMEGAGVWDSLPCVVIKGACDYADSHKVKLWQRYAAATAATCMKAFLESWIPSPSPQSDAQTIAEPATDANPTTDAKPTTTAPSRVLSVPFLRNKKFIGRDTILADLQQKLFIDRDCQSLAVVGLGGVGKTQVALQFAYWTREHHPEYAVLWVSALSRASFEQAYLQLGNAFNVHIEDSDENPMESIRQYLSSAAAGKWLLIVDNADDQELLIESTGIYRYLPESETGITVFTTRSMDIGISVAGSDIIELHEMDEEEAKRYLEKVLIRKELLRDEEKTTELLRELTYLPLAVTQAAAYMNRNRSSIQKYLELLRSTEEDLVSLMGREFQDNTRYRESQNAVATTWIVSFNQVRKADSTAAEILCFIACIEPKAIPRSLLPLSESEEINEHAIGTLLAYAFLTIREDDDMYDMHSLVHLAIRIWLRKEDLVQEVTMKALRHTADIFPSSNLRNRKIWRAYLPHSLRLLDRSKLYRVIERFDLVFIVGKIFYKEHRALDAMACFNEVSQWRKECVMNEDDEFLLDSSHWLGMAYGKNHQFKEAVELLEHVVEIKRRTLDETDESRIFSELELASAYRSDERTKEAIEIFERIVKTNQGIYSENNYKRLLSEHELAYAYLNDGRTKDAIEMLERIVEIPEKTPDETDPYRLSSEHLLALAYILENRTQEAIEKFERVVAIEEKTLDETDRYRLRSEHELARAYYQDKRIKESIEKFEHVVRIQKTTLNEADPERLASEYDLAHAYLRDGRTKEAIVMLERIVEIDRMELNGRIPAHIATEQLLGYAYLEDGNLSNAIGLFEKIAAIDAETLPEDHPYRLRSAADLKRAQEMMESNERNIV